MVKPCFARLLRKLEVWNAPRSSQLNLSPNENTVLEIWDRPPHFISLSFSHFCHNQSLFLSLSITRMLLDAIIFSLSGIYREEKKWTNSGKGLFCLWPCGAFGTGKFSGLNPDGTCGSVGSQHCFVFSSQGWRFPCQCRVSTAKVQPLF